MPCKTFMGHKTRLNIIYQMFVLSHMNNSPKQFQPFIDSRVSMALDLTTLITTKASYLHLYRFQF